MSTRSPRARRIDRAARGFLRDMPSPGPIRAVAPLLALAALATFAPSAARAAPERTGRLLVMLDEPASPRAFTRGAERIDAVPGVRRDGAQVRQLGLVSVRPTGAGTLTELARTLRGRPGVRSVQVEHRHAPRFEPDDPALTAPEQSPGTPAGTALAWWVARSGLPGAWNVTRGDGAIVAVIDSGIDAGHPDLAGKIAGAIDNDSDPRHGPATADEEGHGTHVASLACAAGDNGFGVVGSGLNCRLLVIKTDFGDGSIARSIVQATDFGAHAINMSFGTSGDAPPSRALVDAIDYAVARDVVLVAAAANRPVEEQGDPANVLQPTGTASDITAGRGLSVTAANFAGRRASFAGRGSQISLASFGSFAENGGPQGIFAAFPANRTELEGLAGLPLLPVAGCDCRSTFRGDSRYAYLEGTSMAAPIVAGVAAMARQLNPDATAADVIRALKQTALRPAGSGWNPELGWGILNAGVALDAVRRIDRRAPESKLKGRTRVKRARAFTLRWSGRDAVLPRLKASGIDHFELYRSANRRPWRRIASTTRTRLKVRVKPGSRYKYYTVAVDRAGNREPIPPRPDLITRVDRRR